MKKIYTSMIALALGAVCANAGIEVTFNGTDNALWNAGNNATVENGHLVVPMTESGGKYRQDLSFNNADNAYTLDASTETILAIKFIGTRPHGNMTLEFQNNGAWLNTKWKNTPDGSVTTTKGNTIYYYNLTKDDTYTGTLTVNRINLKVADCTVEPYEYTLDWIKTYPSVEALEVDPDWKDDGENDADEEGDVEYSFINENTGKGYLSFDEMYNDGTMDPNSTLILKDHVVFADRQPTKNVTIKGATGNEKIIQNFDNKLLFASSTRFALENLILTAQKGPGNKPMLEVNNKSCALTLTNVTFDGVKSSNSNGIIDIKNDGILNLNNVNFIDCEGSALNALCKVSVYDGKTRILNLSGKNEGLKVYVEAAGCINATELTNEQPIVLTLSEILTEAPAARSLSENDVIVNGCEDPSKFELTNAGYKLVGENGNLVLAEAGDTTAIDEIGVDGVEAPVEYYNVQGIRVENPEHGLYIKRQGNKVSKVIL